MQLYVINLDRSTARLAYIDAQFSQFDLNFIRIPAIDAHTLSDFSYGEVQKRNIWPQAMTRGEVACFLSHGRALERLVADHVPYGVIFEDDVTLARDAAKWLQQDDWLSKLVAQNSGEVEIVKLETSGKKVWLGQGMKLEGQGRAKFMLAPLKSTHIMGAAYLISRDAALRLLEMMQHKAAPFDHFLFNFSLGNAQKFALYQLDPAIAIQAGLPSSLEEDRAAKHQNAKKHRRLGDNLRREARRLVRRTRTGLWGMKINFFTSDQWKRISFKD